MSRAPIQLRTIAQDDGNGNEVRRLEWRHCCTMDVNGAFRPGSWSDWEEVPELSLVEAWEADQQERRELQIRQAQALFGLTPQPAEPSASQ